MHQFGGSHTAKHVKQAIEEMLNACDTDKQRVHVILHDNIRNMKQAVDDMEAPSVGCISHTSAAVHEGLLSQCSISQCWNSICRKRKSHVKVYTLFQQNKNLLRNAATFFLNAAVLSRKMLVKAKYWIGTRYRQMNIKGLGSDWGTKKPDRDIPRHNYLIGIFGIRYLGSNS